MKNTRIPGRPGSKQAARPIRQNLLRNLDAARKYLESLREFESAGYTCGYSILRAKEEIEKLTRLTS
jgi:hypothetical protein